MQITKTDRTATKTPAQKKPYARPNVVKHGNVETLTQQFLP